MSTHRRSAQKKMKGFTLIELLVVVAIIALLISILLPSLSKAKNQAKEVVCKTRMDQIVKALFMYSQSNRGWLPNSVNPNTGAVGSMWSEAAWWVRKQDLWFYRITPDYLGNEKVLVCPSDPFGSQFNFEAETSAGPRTDVKAFSCGYALNYLLRHYGPESHGYDSILMNIENFRSRRPEATIFMAEVGPDDRIPTAPLYESADPGSSTAHPWRDGGRMVWDDGVRDWYDGEGSWLTARHAGGINMATLVGNVRKVKTTKQLSTPPEARDMDCFNYDRTTKKYLCELCRTGKDPHYTFYEQDLWWWYGTFPL